MKLIIDVGNTASKLAVFQANTLLKIKTSSNDSLIEAFERLLKDYPKITCGILSSVAHLEEQIVKVLESRIQLHVLSHASKLPFTNSYTTPKTLGVDRIALVAAAVFEFPNKDALIIDAGTCITYDFVEKGSHYRGGAISPGLRIRYQALNYYTAKLPVLEKKTPKDLIGVSTEESIHTGVVTGVLKEIEGIILEYTNRYPHLTVILTGGDSKFLSDQLKNSIFATSNFLLNGLNYLLDFNTET